MFAEQADGHGARRSVGQDAIATARPDILDRNGVILATDVKAPSLFAEPRKLIDVDEAEELLTAVLPDLDAKETRDRLSSKRGFVWLKREITPKQQAEIHRLGIPGVGFLTENKRVYPNGPVVSPRDRPRQHRQPGHRRHREMAGRAGARRAAHGGARHRPAAEAGAACARSARAVRAARRARRRAREIQGQGVVRHHAQRQYRRDRRHGVGARLRSEQSARGERSDPHQPAHHRRLRDGLDLQGAHRGDGARLRQGDAVVDVRRQPPAAIRPLRHPRLRADAPRSVGAGDFHLFLEHRRRAHGAGRRRARATRRSCARWASSTGCAPNCRKAPSRSCPNAGATSTPSPSPSATACRWRRCRR